MQLSSQQINAFQNTIISFYHKKKRDYFAWRQEITPYKVVVSELMLQQTQTARVVPKFAAWMQQLPHWQALAQVDTRTLLTLWSGLGYNRRALALRSIAQKVMSEYGGELPACPYELQNFPGIGSYTAGAICAFAFNKPVVFIETNIRTVFAYHFFKEGQLPTDKELLLFAEKFLCASIEPRQWYYALMDYGAFLKEQKKDTVKKQKQSRFQGSRRQVRGTVLRLLTQHTRLQRQELLYLVQEQLPHNQHVKEVILEELLQEELLQESNGMLLL